jgi:3-hydroxymyristoyl/3-hydroxydecanoyl-(acyl carrier protein) dehydratase
MTQLMIEPKKVLNLGKDKKPQLIQSSDGSSLYQVEWSVPADLPYFEGHFPGHPILPAVGILDVSIEFLRQVLHKDELYIRAVPHTKVMELMTPGMKFQIEAKNSGDSWQFQWKSLTSSEPKPAAELTIQL